MTSFLSQDPVDIAEGLVDGSVVKCTFFYKGDSGSPKTYFVVLSADCSGGVCQHMFNVPTSSVTPFYTVSVTATNVVGEGHMTTSQPIRKPKLNEASIIVAILHESQMIEMVLAHSGR